MKKIFLNQKKQILLILIFFSSLNLIYGQEKILSDKRIPIMLTVCGEYFSPEMLQILLYDVVDSTVCSTMSFSKDKKQAWLYIQKSKLYDKQVKIYFHFRTFYPYFSLGKTSLQNIFEADTIQIEIYKPQEYIRAINFIMRVRFFSNKNNVWKQCAQNRFELYYPDLPRKYRKEMRKRRKNCPYSPFLRKKW